MSETMQIQNGAEVESIELEPLHARLADRLQKLKEVTPDNYDMSAERLDGDFGLWSVSISSDDSPLVQGEIGDMTFHVILGPRGGLKTASHDRMLGSHGDYTDEYDSKTMAWELLLSGIERAK
jgi:hypothetical protein